jgi:hypothetical protein
MKARLALSMAVACCAVYSWQWLAAEEQKPAKFDHAGNWKVTSNFEVPEKGCHSAD